MIAAVHQKQVLQGFQGHIQSMMDVLSVEITALAWKLAAEVMEKELSGPHWIRPVLASAIDEQKKQIYIDVGKIPPEKANEFIDRVAKRYGNSKVFIKGPRPAKRAHQYARILRRRTGAGYWSRRDSKVKYTVCDTKEQNGRTAFYRMRRVDNGHEKWVKFTSIVSDWKHVP